MGDKVLLINKLIDTHFTEITKAIDAEIDGSFERLNIFREIENFEMAAKEAERLVGLYKNKKQIEKAMKIT